MSIWKFCGRTSFQLQVVDIFYPSIQHVLLAFITDEQASLKSADKGVFEIVAKPHIL